MNVTESDSDLSILHWVYSSYTKLFTDFLNFILTNEYLHYYSFLCFSLFSLTLVIYPYIVYVIKYIRAIMHPLNLNYKHVLVTGAGSGLGKAFVEELYMKGAYITMIGRNQEKLQKVAQSVDVINGINILSSSD